MRRVPKMLAVAGLGGMLACPVVQADETQGVTATTIRIANLGPYTGSGAPVSVINFGIDAYLRHVNAQGGIHGRKFESIQSDDGCNEAKAIAAAKKALYEDKVFAFVGPTCSGPAMAVKPMLDQEGVIWVGAAGQPKLTTPTVPTMFHVIYNGDAAGANMARFAVEKKDVKKVALVQHSTEWAHGSCVPAANALKAAGIEVMADVALEMGASDASAQVLKVKSSGAEMIMACMYQPELVILLRDMRRFGVTTPVIGALGADFDQVVQQVNDPAAVKGIFFMPYPYQAPLGQGPLKAVRDMLKANLKPNEMPREGDPTNFYYYGVQVGVVLAEAVRRAGPDLTRKKFVAAMEGMKDFDTHVFADKVTLSPTDHVGVKKTAYIGVGDDGKPAIYSRWGVPMTYAGQ